MADVAQPQMQQVPHLEQDAHSAASSDGGGDVFMSPRSSVASKHSVQSVPTTVSEQREVHKCEPEGEPHDDNHEDGHDERESLMQRSSLGRRETWISEGLIDAGGLDAIDRLSDVAYSELVKKSMALRRDGPPSEEDVAAKDSQVHEFLQKAYPHEAGAQAEGGAKDAPKPSRRRRKLLDFLANDVGERYLNGVYKEEQREAGEDDSGSEDFGTDSEEPKVEDFEAKSNRTNRTNSRLLAFLAQEQGSKTHSGEKGSSSYHRSSLSSAGSGGSARSLDQKEANGQATRFVTKTVPQKPRTVLFNPKEVGMDELGQLVAEEAERKRKAREDKEKARQKVIQFLVEEEEEAHRKNSGNGATIKSVDEASVRREKVVDSYGTVKLLDFLERNDSVRHGDNTHGVKSSGGSAPSEHSSTPPSDASSPKSLASSLEADSNTSFTHVTEDVELPTPTNHLDRMGNRINNFLRRGGASSGSNKHEDNMRTPRSRRILPPSPFGSSNPFNDKSSLEAVFHAAQPNLSAPPSTAYSNSSSRMTPLLATLDQITHTCQQTELSEVAIARISTLLTSMSQIVREDVHKNRGQPNRVIRRLSSAKPWVKSDKELHELDKLHKAAPIPPRPTPEVPRDSISVPTASATVENVKVKTSASVLNSFKAFDAAQNLVDTLASFNKLLTDCGLNGIKVDEPWRVYNHIKAAVYSKLGFRQKQLFKLLDARFNMEVYKRKPAAKKRVCIIGAGPVGLRAAVETALLGGQVVVLEKRKHFSRENILHLWPWVVQDLTALGAKVFFPQFCHSTAYFHVGTRQLQCILLKVALLLGVTVYSSTAFESLVSPNSEENENKPFYTVATRPQIPCMEFTAVLGASGTSDKLAEQAGINRFVFSRKEALGIVCYFPNHGTTEEKKVTEFSWTIQFKQQMFAKMRDIGVDLENLVYYRGEMHYLVMTPKRQNLLEQKVLKENHPDVNDLVVDANVNKNVLHEYVKRVVGFVGIPKKADFARIRLFDFSTRTRADKAASILSSNGKKLYCGLVGDSLMEPFWPEGLGTCRGFLGSLDAVWMVAQIGKKSDDQLLADREMAYRVTQHVSGFRRDDLQKNVRKYNVDPKSRYTVKFPQLC